jgi:hypothetical protein
MSDCVLTLVIQLAVVKNQRPTRRMCVPLELTNCAAIRPEFHLGGLITQ